MEWRCLDTTHLKSCTACTAPPSFEDESGIQFKLAAQHGASATNGEKLMRSLLSSTPEWRCKETRAALADTLNAPADAELAQLLRARNLSKLRKPFALQLCRLWRYRSDIWQPRTAPGERRQRSGARPARAASTALAAPRRRTDMQLLPPLLLSVSLDGLRHLVDTCLRPTTLRSASMMRGDLAEAAGRRGELSLDGADVHKRLADSQLIDPVAGVLRAGLQDSLAAATAQLAAERAREATHGPEPHAVREHFLNGPCEPTIRTLHAAFSAVVVDMRAQAHTIWPVWRRETWGSMDTMFGLLASSHAAQAPFCTTTHGDYLEASVLTLAALDFMLAQISESFFYRAGWVRELLLPQETAEDCALMVLPTLGTVMEAMVEPLRAAPAAPGGPGGAWGLADISAGAIARAAATLPNLPDHLFPELEAGGMPSDWVPDESFATLLEAADSAGQ